MFDMRIKSIIFFILLSFAAFAWAEASDMAEIKPPADNEVYTGEFTYLIGPGDMLEIKVWRHPDMEIKAAVRPDGKISFPTVGDISANNMTVAQLENNIVKNLNKIINNPQVTVNVISFYSKKIFVLGEVNRPGVYPFEGRVSVIDAISRAAGYKENTAALKSVMVISAGGTPKQKQSVLRLNISDLIKKGDLSQNVYLMPGDIVFVPKTFISDVNTFIDQFFAKTDPVLQYYLDIYNIKEPGVLSR